MAEFRKLFYALGFAAMLAGVSPAASAREVNSAPIIQTDVSDQDLIDQFARDIAGGAVLSNYVASFFVPAGKAVAKGQVNTVVALIGNQQDGQTRGFSGTFQYWQLAAITTSRLLQSAKAQDQPTPFASQLSSVRGSVPQPLVAMGSSAQGFHGAPVVLRW